MPETFDPRNMTRLDNPERKKEFPQKKILQWAGLKKGQRMFDFGAGTGFFALSALKLTGKTGAVFAYDREPLMVQEMEKRAAALKTSRSKVLSISSNFESLKEAAGKIDFFWLSNVLHEIEDPFTLLKTACEMLKENGTLAILEWRKIPTERGPKLEERISEGQMKDLLLESGFGLVETRIWNATHYLMKAAKVGSEQIILPPKKRNFLLRTALVLVEKGLGKKLRVNRILAWYPKALIGSGLLEVFIAHNEPEVPARLLKLLRIFVSYSVSCPFCIDMNAKDFPDYSITGEELDALRGRKEFYEVTTFTEREIYALKYAECLTKTPVRLYDEVVTMLKKLFSERSITIIASTVGQVNFWARLIQGFGIYEAGFTKEFQLLELKNYGKQRSI